MRSLSIFSLFLMMFVPAGSALGQEKPNFIIIFCDDLGYGDVGVYGSPDIRTPHIDQMAWEGLKFTSFYAQPVCGPSRAALMTGSYPPRVSLAFNHLPKFETGIHTDEITIAELLKTRGYATAIFGKWHLGDRPEFSPTKNGFDYFFGLPYSNDMWPFHPRMPLGPHPDPRLIAGRRRAEMTGFPGQGTDFAPGEGFPDPLPLIRNEEVIELNPDQSTFTARFTDEALRFIAEHRSQPFFVYLASAMPHVPLFPGQKFQGTSVRGLYGDAVEEIDSSVGQILAKLKELGLDEKTLVVFTSDNGPWLQYGIDGGSAGPLTKGKGTPWEGGIRVPGIFRWPGKIPSQRVTTELATTMDLLPTFARLAGSRAPADRVIDGHNIWPLLAGEPGAGSPYDAFYYYGADLFGKTGSKGPSPTALIPKLQAIRKGEWKLHLDEETLRGTALYNLGNDLGERENVLARYPEVAKELEGTAKKFNDDLKRHIRPLGRVTAE